MSHYVYILASHNNDKFVTYVGYTKNLNKRLKLHNEGKGAKFTRGRQWKIIYREKYSEEKTAKVREYYIKKNRKFRNLIKKKFDE